MTSQIDRMTPAELQPLARQVLTPAQYTTWWEHHIQGYAVTEIAERCGKHIVSIYQRLERARLKLEWALEHEDYERCKIAVDCDKEDPTVANTPLQSALNRYKHRILGAVKGVTPMDTLMKPKK